MDALDRLAQQAADGAALRAAVKRFDPAWAAMSIREQERLVRLLVEQVAVDGAVGKVAVTFRETGILTLGKEAQP